VQALLEKEEKEILLGANLILIGLRKQGLDNKINKPFWSV